MASTDEDDRSRSITPIHRQLQQNAGPTDPLDAADDTLSWQSSSVTPHSLDAAAMQELFLSGQRPHKAIPGVQLVPSKHELCLGNTAGVLCQGCLEGYFRTA